MQETTSKSPSF